MNCVIHLRPENKVKNVQITALQKFVSVLVYLKSREI